MNKQPPSDVFTVFPAIDLLDGQSVRLAQGRRDSAHTVHADPLQQLREYCAQGAAWVHIVNLNAAFGDDPVTHQGARLTEKVLSYLVAHSGVQIQLGGGIRSMAALDRALDLGVSRVVIGTWAMTHFNDVMQRVQRAPERFVIGVDSLNGHIAIRGWTQTVPETTLEFAKRLKASGVQRVLFTEVERDGLLQGAAVESSAALAAGSGLSVIASGGVASLDDIRALKQCHGVCGVVTGKALADGKLSLSEAISLARR